MFIDKPVEYHRVYTHDLYKSFVYTNSTYSGDGLTINDSVAPQSDSISEKEKTTSYNHYFLKHNFYSVYNNSGFYALKSNYSKQNNHVLPETATYISIPIRSFGKRILQGSLSITTGAYTLVDDGNGNLIDNSISSSFDIFPTDGMLCWFSFIDGYTYKEFPYKKVLTLRDSSVNMQTMTFVNPKYTQTYSISNLAYSLVLNDLVTDRNYAYIDNAYLFDFNKSDFTIAFQIATPTDQAYSSSELNTIISKKSSLEEKYPFHIQIYNQSSANAGKLLITRQGYKDNVKLQPISFTSSLTINDDYTPHDIQLTKNGDMLELYIDGTLDATVKDYTGYFDTSNSQKIFIGAEGNGISDIIPNSFYSGFMNNLVIYNKAIDVTKLSPIYSGCKPTDIVGSIFYEKGIIVLYNLYNIYDLNSSIILTYKSVSQLTQHEISIRKDVNEFNMTLNPSIRKEDLLTMIPQVSSSITNNLFTPYITTIGLYNDKNELLVIGKIRQPIKSIKDLILYFKIQFDL